jgi:mono/diheme cytochrome c family protein
MRRTHALFAVLAGLIITSAGAQNDAPRAAQAPHSAVAAARPQDQTVSFYRQIKPILKKRCQGCHQPALQGGKLVLTSYEAFKAGAASGPSFVPGHPEHSAVMRYIVGNPPAMPKNQKPLSEEDVDAIRRWIAQGAKNDTPIIKDPIDADHPPTYQHAPVISALAWSPDGRTLAVSGFREVLLHKAGPPPPRPPPPEEGGGGVP